MTLSTPHFPDPEATQRRASAADGLPAADQSPRTTAAGLCVAYTGPWPIRSHRTMAQVMRAEVMRGEHSMLPVVWDYPAIPAPSGVASPRTAQTAGGDNGAGGRRHGSPVTGGGQRNHG